MTPAARSTITIVVGRLALGEAQRRDARTRARPALDARREGVPVEVLEALDPDGAEPLLGAEPPPGLVDGPVVPEDPAERAGECRAVATGGAGVVRGGTGAGTETVGAGTGTGTGTGTVGVGSVGTVTVGRVGGAGGSRASAGATSVVAAATAQHRIGEAFRIRLYNPDRPRAVTASDA